MPISNSSSTPPSLPQARPSGVLLGVAAVAFVGFLDAAYLTADHYLALPLPCTILHGCETVLRSPFSMVGPVPLALLGVGYYLGVLGLSLFLYTSQAMRRPVRRLLGGLAATGLAMSAVFEGIQFFLIHAMCMYCAISALCTVALAALSIPLLDTGKLRQGPSDEYVG